MFDYVDLNHEMMANGSVRQALYHGYERPALVTLKKDMIHGCCFEVGYRQEMTAHHLDVDDELIIRTGKSGPEGFAAMKKLMRLPEPTDFVIFINDL